ncbi:alpha/beta hydrolase [Subtercola boreus]|nr:alpha/beta hydrolase-fold protein [Subtercola boreus]TQL53433.1 enterochelin esterase-like enzyme [Subtercola boreus]
MGSLGSASIVDGPVVWAVYAVAALLALCLLLVRPNRGWLRGRWVTVAVVSMLVGAGAGLLLTWFTDDLLNLFGVDFSFVTRAWIAVSVAGVALGFCSVVAGRLRRKLLGIVGVLVFLATGAMSINIDIGTYPTLQSLAGVSPYDTSTLPALGRATTLPMPLEASWVPPSNLPAAGSISSVRIPGTVSGFDARDGLVYLPPAALVANPPVLPVVIALSGQPGAPADPLVSGHLAESLDAFAKAHHGLAPIVVSPDQLGAPENNPMCVDGALGNAATYLTVDVVAWITAHLPVADPPDQWAIAGFSEGGTCAVQLGAEHPELFGALLDISGELVPTNGSTVQETIDSGFAGSLAAYTAAQPLTILKEHTPYAGSFAVFAVGENDAEFRTTALEVSAAAKAAGMTTTFFEAPGSAHDYTTATYAFARGVALLSSHWGLAT